LPSVAVAVVTRILKNATIMRLPTAWKEGGDVFSKACKRSWSWRGWEGERTGWDAVKDGVHTWVTAAQHVVHEVAFAAEAADIQRDGTFVSEGRLLPACSCFISTNRRRANTFLSGGHIEYESS
jgi:hypothetical protein